MAATKSEILANYSLHSCSYKKICQTISKVGYLMVGAVNSTSNSLVFSLKIADIDSEVLAHDSPGFLGEIPQFSLLFL